MTCESFGMSPSADAASNAAAFQQCLNQQGNVSIVTPGTFAMNFGATIKSGTQLDLGAGVVLQQVAGATSQNFLANANWNAPPLGTTIPIAVASVSNGSQRAVGVLAFSGQSLPVNADTGRTIAVGDYVEIIGDTSNQYNQVYQAAYVNNTAATAGWLPAYSIGFVLPGQPGSWTPSTGPLLTVFAANADIAVTGTGVIDSNVDYVVCPNGQPGVYASAIGNHTLIFSHHTNTQISGVTIENSCSYAVDTAHTFNMDFGNVTLNNVKACIQSDGVFDTVNVHDITGTGLYDDCMAFIAGTSPGYEPVILTNVNMALNGPNNMTGVMSKTLLNGRNLTISNINLHTLGGGRALQADPSQWYGGLSHIVVSNYSILSPHGSYFEINQAQGNAYASPAYNAYIDDIEYDNTSQLGFSSQSGTVVGQYTINRCNSGPENAGATGMGSGDGTDGLFNFFGEIDNAIIENCTLNVNEATIAGQPVVTVGGNMGALTFSNNVLQAVGTRAGMIGIFVANGNLDSLTVSGGRFAQTGGLGYLLETTGSAQIGSVTVNNYDFTGAFVTNTPLPSYKVSGLALHSAGFANAYNGSSVIWRILRFDGVTTDGGSSVFVSNSANLTWDINLSNFDSTGAAGSGWLFQNAASGTVLDLQMINAIFLSGGGLLDNNAGNLSSNLSLNNVQTAVSLLAGNAAGGGAVAVSAAGITLSVPGNAATGSLGLAGAATLSVSDPDGTLVPKAFPVVVANNDGPVTIPGPIGGSVDVLGNDTVNGSPATVGTAANVFLPSIVSNGGLLGVAVNPAGQLTAPANTPTNSYQVTYQICAVVAPQDCAAAVASITVQPGADMAAAFSGFPAVVAGAGKNISGEIVCTNQGNANAVSPVCSIDHGSLSACRLSSGKALPANIGKIELPPQAAIRCKVNIATAPTSGNLAVNAATGSQQDINPANNHASLLIPVISAVSDGSVDVLASAGASIDVLANDTVGGQTAQSSGTGANISTPVLVSKGGLSGLNFNAAGSLLAPAGEKPGVYPIKYRICSLATSGKQVCSQAGLTIKVLKVMPAANSDAVAALSGVPVSVAVTANDAAAAGADLAFGSIDLNPEASGRQDSLSFVGKGVFATSPAANDGVVTFTPASGFSGTLTIPYTVADTLAKTSNPANITVTVAGSAATQTANPGYAAAPVANDDYAVTAADTPVAVTLLANDVAAAGNSLTPATLALTPPLTTAYGVWQFDVSTAELTFTPAAGAGVFNMPYTVQDDQGNVSNTAIVRVVVTGGDSPLAVNDTATTRMNTPVILPILDNDSASVGNTLLPETLNLSPTTPDAAVTRIDTAAGLWETDFSGLLTFTPAAHVPETGRPFTGTAALDYAVNDSGSGNAPAQASISILVAPTSLHAVADRYSTLPGQSISFQPAVNDSADAGAVLNPATLSLAAGSGKLPGKNQINREPVATRHGVWQIVDGDGTVRFSANPAFTGVDSLDYAIADSIGNTAVATITIHSYDLRPANYLLYTPEDTSLSATVRRQGNIPAQVALALNSGVVNGVLEFNANGGFSYTPVSGFTGSDGFTYRACLPAPDNGVCATATVGIQVGSKISQSISIVPASATAISAQAMNLSVVGGPGGGAVTMQVLTASNANCKLSHGNGIWRLKAETATAGICAIQAIKAADSIYAAAVSAPLIINIRK
ncbi:MAG: Ig-like domain-containing protein [Methylococcales bacterium]|nr:Ig-like domain-containing protein [Methylococcales bacterium]